MSTSTRPPDRTTTTRARDHSAAHASLTEGVDEARPEAVLRAVADALPVLVWTADPAGRVSYVNLRWRIYTGQADARADDPLAAIHPDDRPAWDAAWDAARRTEQIFTREVRLAARDGSHRTFRMQAEPIRDGASGALLWFGTAVEAGARVRGEDELAELFVRVERARVESAEANAAKDRFLSVLSHELRAPLQAMLGWLGLLREGDVDAATRARAVAMLEAGVAAQSGRIHELLDVSRIVSGRLVLDAPLAVDVRLLVETAAENARQAAGAKQMTIVTTVFEDARVAGDQARLHQVLANVLDNAVKFGREGGRIDVVTQRAGDHVAIVVRDDGEGISPDVLPYVFDRFAQPNVVRTRRHGGLGLGLTIAHHLVALHGGRMSAESDGPGLGTRIRIELPVEHPLKARAVESRGAAAAVVGRAIQGTHLLLVEDDDSTREALALYLEHEGAVVTTARSVREALAAYGRNVPEVIVSDIGMPNEDGYALIREIRAREAASARRTAALAMTGFSRHQDERLARNAGFDDFLAKPFEPELLITHIRRLLG